MRRIRIVNGRIITPGGILSNATLLIAGGRIVAVGEGNIETPASPDFPEASRNLPEASPGLPEASPDLPEAIVIDAAGAYVSPGFIDLHVHGGGGHDFMDGTEEAFQNIASLHARHGTTAMTPTTLSAGKQELLTTLETYKHIAAQQAERTAPENAIRTTLQTGITRATSRHAPGASFIGMHLEGPYFAMNQRGAQDPRHIRNPDPAEYRELTTRFPGIRRWSAAPELPGALELADWLRSKNILAAWAHTDALYDEILIAFGRGYTHATHLYSAMLGVTRRGAARYAGAIEAAFLIDGMTVEIIADGIHLPPPLLRLVCKLKGPGNIALITDAMRGAGMPPGESILGGKHNGLPVIIEDGVAKLPDRSAFAGSVATADRLVRNMITLAGQSVTDAVRMMTSTPAAIMGVDDRKGSIQTGKDADIVIFDEDINIHYTIIGGEIVYTKQKDLHANR